jgi:hypothetical protein
MAALRPRAPRPIFGLPPSPHNAFKIMMITQTAKLASSSQTPTNLYFVSTRMMYRRHLNQYLFIGEFSL